MVYIFRGSPCTVNVYALQCKRCFKWRVVKTLEEYEEIRSTFREDPFFCNKKQGISCDDPCDIEYDNSRTWAVDKPNLPKTPNGLRRNVEVRRDFSGCDVHYEMPNGERVRSLLEARKFLESHPEYKSRVSLLDFEFTAPVIMKDTIPGYVG
ncbi:Methyl-CpG-binding domain protein 4 [Ranunculus cassubicifolius]